MIAKYYIILIKIKKELNLAIRSFHFGNKIASILKQAHLLFYGQPRTAASQYPSADV